MAKRLIQITVLITTILVALLPGVAAADTQGQFDLQGLAFEDIDGNGVYASIDRPLEDVIIRLVRDQGRIGVWDASDEQIDAVRSGADGVYTFTGVTAGRYLIVQFAPLGYACTSGEVIALNLDATSLLTIEQLSFANVYDEVYPTLSHRVFLPSIAN